MCGRDKLHAKQINIFCKFFCLSNEHTQKFSIIFIGFLKRSMIHILNIVVELDCEKNEVFMSKHIKRKISLVAEKFRMLQETVESDRFG